MERVVVFIDGSNLYYCLKMVRGITKFDFVYMVNRIIAERELIRVYYYNAPINPNENAVQYKEQQKFFNYIKSLSYFELKLGRLVQRDGRTVQKGVDVKLATDMVAFACKNIYDTAILISSDGDFADAIQHVKDFGKHVEVAYPEKKFFHLRNVCDKFVYLDESYIHAV